MSLKKVLEKLDFSVDDLEMESLKEETARVVGLLKKEAGRRAEVFVGGSFAKGTLGRSEDYDIDIFVRFNKIGDLSSELEKIVKKTAKAMKLRYDRLHGSRDYFKIKVSRRLTFEIIPVLKVRRVSESENVTDLSYSHVNFVKRALKKGLEKDVRLAKQFCKVLGVYGAESYINGFSGYALECLIIYYGGFEKMVRRLALVKEKEIIDIRRFYKGRADVLVEMNSSKTAGPIVLVDPTWKERNVLAALNWDSFRRFQEGAKKLIRKPDKGFFEIRELDVDLLRGLAKRRKGEFVHVRLKTDRQAGDIAGTKMKKFAGFLSRELGKWFVVVGEEFVYGGGRVADLYFVLLSKREVVRAGPPVKMKKEVREFRKGNRGTFVRKGRVWTREKVRMNGKEMIKKLGKGFGVKMGVSNVKVG